jgi:hypothetical protein
MYRASVAFLIMVVSSAAAAQTIVVSKLSQAPEIDGNGSEWRGVSSHTIVLTPTRPDSKLEGREVMFKAGHFDGQVYFYAQWPDDKGNIVHRPYRWDDGAQRYTKGSEREDRFAVQFEMSGEYSSDWANASDFKADMWHWKASRSNPLGLAHDKVTTLSSSKLIRAASIPSSDGSSRYVFRESDEGTALYRTLRYSEVKEQEIMPKYELLPDPQGSIADVKAKGAWRDGNWHLELSRKFDTGHDDDTQFKLNQAVRGGIAVFDASSENDHVISETLLFQF